MSGIKKSYTKQEWEAREQYYINKIQTLSIPIQPVVKDIVELTSKIDALLTEALFDFSTTKRDESRISLEMKNAEAELFVTIKQNQLKSGGKVTENDIKGLVKKFLKSNDFSNYGENVYTVFINAQDRHSFMEGVVKCLSEKKSSLIADVSMLKLENSFASSKDDRASNCDTDVLPM